MKRQVWAAVWTMVGAMVGAGFASGREIASFFSQYNIWSFVGIMAAIVVVVWLTLRVMQNPSVMDADRKKYGEKLRTALFAALMTTTGGTMLAAAGEIVALTLPVHGARWIGMACTMLLASWMTARENRRLAGVSKLLMVCMLGVLLLGLWIQPSSAVAVTQPVIFHHLPEVVLRGICYGGFNIALVAPVIGEEAKQLSVRQHWQCALLTGGILGILLLLGNAVLLRHPALISEALPFLRLTEALGLWGYGLSALTLYLAMLTTLTACLRGLSILLKRWWCMLLPLVVALLGFSQAVDILYPLLGGVCFLLLLMVRKSAQSP